MTFKFIRLVTAFQEGHPETRLQDLAYKILPGKNPHTARAKFSEWCNGSTTGMTPEVIIRICQVLEVSPNQLFDYEPSSEG